MKQQKIGLYLRLSDEDDNECQDESNSITSQREILNAYVESHGEFTDYTVAEFCDDGYSGTHFCRPGVQKMLEEIKAGRITVVIVKDFSRFGRNYIEVGNYLEQVFPFLGIRFISVNDGFDSGVVDFSGEFFDVAFKNLIYDLYSKDLSEKVTSVRHMKARQGKFITPNAPYGYLKGSGQKLVPDPEAAPVVRRIFQMATEGVPKAHIANALNRENVPSPLALRRRRGEHFPCKTVNGNSVWRAAAIFSILKDQRYVGDIVYGKVKPTAVGSGKDRAVPKEEWIIVSDVHEPIVSRSMFEKVNQMMQKRPFYDRDGTAPLAGKVRCAGCNHMISRVKRSRRKGGEGATYRCGMQNMTREFGCCPLTVEESCIEGVLLTMLRKAVELIADPEMIEKAENLPAQRAEESERLIAVCTSEINRLTRERMEKYEAYKDGLLTREEFTKEKTLLDGQMNELTDSMEKARRVLTEVSCDDTGEPNVFSLLEHFAPFETLTREMVDTFVRQVFICQDGSLRIEWKFKDFLKIF